MITKYLVGRSKKYYDNVIIFQNSTIITLTEKSYQSGNLTMDKEGKKNPNNDKIIEKSDLKFD